MEDTKSLNNATPTPILPKAVSQHRQTTHCAILKPPPIFHNLRTVTHSYDGEMMMLMYKNGMRSPPLKIQPFDPLAQSFIFFLLYFIYDEAPPPDEAVLLLTASRCCLFLRWTSKFSTVQFGPGVYSFPGQSLHLMRGSHWNLM